MKKRISFILTLALSSMALVAMPVSDISNKFPPTLPTGRVELTEIYSGEEFSKNSHIVTEGVQLLKDATEDGGFTIDIEGVRLVPLENLLNKSQHNHWSYSALNYVGQLGLLDYDDVVNYIPTDTVSQLDVFYSLNNLLMIVRDFSSRNTRVETLSLLSELNKNTVEYHTVASIISRLTPETAKVYTLNPTYLSSNTLTRKQLADLVYELTEHMNLPQCDYEVSYSDLLGAPESIVYCSNINVMSGDNLRKFNPERPVTWSELVTVLERLYKTIIKNNKITQIGGMYNE